MEKLTPERPPDSPKPDEVSFVADARLISILGEQLIGSEKVGVLELVKNAYDADASTCVVTIEGAPGLPSQTRALSEYAALPGPVIEIRDDGTGMNRDDIVSGWLRPATARTGSAMPKSMRNVKRRKRQGDIRISRARTKICRSLRLWKKSKRAKKRW